MEVLSGRTGRNAVGEPLQDNGTGTVAGKQSIRLTLGAHRTSPAGVRSTSTNARRALTCNNAAQPVVHPTRRDPESMKPTPSSVIRVHGRTARRARRTA